MRKRHAAAYLGALVAVSAAAGTWNASPALAQDTPVQLKLAHWVPPTHPLQKAMEDPTDPELLPEPLKDQGRSDLLGRGLGVPFAGENQKDFFRESRKGSNQVFDLSSFLKIIHPANRGDDPLDGLWAIPAVLDDLEVLMRPRFFDSGKHRVPPL